MSPIPTRGLMPSAVTSAKILDGTIVAGDLASGAVGAANLSTNLKKGFINLPLGNGRWISSNEIPVIAVASGNGGNLAKDSAPNLERINSATDIGLQIQWLANGVEEVQWQFAYPPDLDDTAAVTVNLLGKMGGATDTPVVGVKYFEGVGDSDAGGNTAAFSSTLAQKTVTITAANIGTYPNFASISLTPAAHANDTLNLYGLWIEYTRKD